MDRKHNRSDSSDYSCDKRSSKTDSHTYYTSSQRDTSDRSGKSCTDSSRSGRSDYTDHTDHTDRSCDRSSDRSCDRSSDRSRDRSSDRSCDRSCDRSDSDSCDGKRKHRRRKSDCKFDCGLKFSETLVGVWNLVYSCDNACTTTGTMEWLNQLMLNGDNTLNIFIPPDVTNNPFGSLILTTGAGVWKQVSDRKLKFEVAHIAYRTSDGCPQAYVKSHIIFKLNRKRTRARFCGEACFLDLKDPSMCTPTDRAPVCFSGHGTKVLEPRGCKEYTE